MKNFNLRFQLFLVGLMTFLNIFSQDNHNYGTPLGKSLFYREVRDANRTILRMSEIAPVTSGMDGLTVVFNMRQNLSQLSRPLKLLSFTNGTEENSYLDIFYDSGTIVVRRKLSSGSNNYYDYILYDPMFTVNQGVSQWEVHLFFTGFFLWVETRDTRKLLENKWRTPIFFGINLPDHNYMNDYLGRSNSSIIVFGDANPSATFTMPDEIAIYEFKYIELRKELQTHFCEDN